MQFDAVHPPNVQPAQASILRRIAAVDGNLSTAVLAASVRIVSNIYSAAENRSASQIEHYRDSIPYAINRICENVASTLIMEGTTDLVQLVESHVVLTVLVAPLDTAIGWPVIDLAEATGASGCLRSTGNCPVQAATAGVGGVAVELPAMENLMSPSARRPNGNSAAQFVVYADDRLFSNSSTTGDSGANSQIISVAVAGARTSGKMANLQRVSLTFPTRPNTTAAELKNRQCSFFGEEGSIWRTEGCTVDSYASTNNMTVCSCDHLTSFAVLMHTDPAAGSSTPAHHQTALSIITYIGTGMSLACIIVTLSLYGWYQEALVTPKKILVHLCIALALSLVSGCFAVVFR